MNLHPYGLRKSCSHTVDERGQGDCDIFGAIRIGELRISGLKHDVVPTCVHPLEGGSDPLPPAPPRAQQKALGES